jgi:hypothetical protein
MLLMANPLLLTIVSLLLTLPAASSIAAPAEREPIDVQVVAWSSGTGPDEVSFVYASPAKSKEARQNRERRARQDFQALSAAFGQAGAPVKIRTVAEPVQAPPTTSAEGKLRHLVNRPAGWLNIGPFLKVFSRYQRLTLTFQVMPPFTFQGPRGPLEDQSLAMSLDHGGTAYTYRVQLKHPEGQAAAALPAFEPPRRGLPQRLGKAVYLVVGLMALAAGVAVYSLAQYWMGRKSAGEGAVKSE